MADDNSPRLLLPLLHAGQAQKELFHNEALMRLDLLVHAAVASAGLATPPVSPGIGQCWIVAAGATGDWAGQEGAIAMWSTGGWRFVAGREGMRLWVTDRAAAMQHDGAGWDDEAMRADGFYVNGDKIIGARASAIADPGAGGATVDAEARSVIVQILSALRSHGLVAS
ncbi:DUF2793 domain-containing protein [Sphingobium aquiterrae]|uniref:DUF2793 domain-containing protein n=1 Tax=Sphingobium aquiterrae TaxID=2038656 RepID=UPI00301A1489